MQAQPPSGDALVIGKSFVSQFQEFFIFLITEPCHLIAPGSWLQSWAWMATQWLKHWYTNQKSMSSNPSHSCALKQLVWFHICKSLWMKATAKPGNVEFCMLPCFCVGFQFHPTSQKMQKGVLALLNVPLFANVSACCPMMDQHPIQKKPLLVTYTCPLSFWSVTLSLNGSTTVSTYSAYVSGKYSDQDKTVTEDDRR